ncbi:MAG TPA: hypothetical protein VHS53_07120, partial [Mucilaginibacter sp.]|nr:hypothetical protein [Mucilaginibacter sp.]
MKKPIILAITFLFMGNLARSQGCIIVRNISGFGQYNVTENAFSTSPWQLDVSNRYFEAYKDYKETHDQHTPPPNQNIIKSFTTDIGLTRLFNKGWSVNLSLPIADNS